MTGSITCALSVGLALSAASTSNLLPALITGSLARSESAAAMTLQPLASLQQEIGTRSQTTVQQFMQSLLAYGTWMSHPQFGWVWQPHDVQPWWQPFSVGEWIVTRDGSPYWRSGLPFGWATEHYGSWTYDENRGWLWVPSNDWSAAPVSWRAREGVIGWAPRIATTANTQPSDCPQPSWAWLFIASNRLMTTSNFAVAEQDLMSRDTHGTWGSWAHESDGLAAARMPEPRNANLLEATQCLSAADAKSMFGAAVLARGGTTNGPPISWVLRRSEMGSGRVLNGRLPVYAPIFTGSPPPPGDRLLVNPPAPTVQRAMPLTRAQPIPRSAPRGTNTPATPRPSVQPVPPALPTPAVVPATPLTPYEAFTYQQEALDEHHASQFEALRKLQAADDTAPPYPGFDMSKLPAWKQREMREMQRMAARQRKLLDARQSAYNESDASAPVTEPTSTPTSTPSSTPESPAKP
jgi:hypothetical protein